MRRNPYDPLVVIETALQGAVRAAMQTGRRAVPAPSVGWQLWADVAIALESGQHSEYSYASALRYISEIVDRADAADLVDGAGFPFWVSMAVAALNGALRGGPYLLQLEDWTTASVIEEASIDPRHDQPGYTPAILAASVINESGATIRRPAIPWGFRADFDVGSHGKQLDALGSRIPPGEYRWLVWGLCDWAVLELEARVAAAGSYQYFVSRAQQALREGYLRHTEPEAEPEVR